MRTGMLNQYSGACQNADEYPRFQLVSFCSASRVRMNGLKSIYCVKTTSYFCPQIISERLIHGKPHQSLESLFPGYLFIQLSRDDKWAPLRSTRGVSRIVDFNHGPATVPDDVIEHLRARCFKPPESHTPQPFKPGETLQITRGPLSTLEGIFPEHVR